MYTKNVRVSIIIVNYKSKEFLSKCIESIYSSTKNIQFEIIVVDNDERQTIKNYIINKFPKVHYLKNDNKGFGQGNNIGAKKASGKYLFFLNPDTIVYPNSIENLALYFIKNKKAGIVAPVLLDNERMPYELQGFTELTPLKAVFALSFLNKIFPNNKFSQMYWQKNSNKNNVRKVFVVPGTALMIKKDLFDKLGGFDENYFLYFEENDLCKRVKDAGFEIIMIPTAKIFHEWGVSTGRSGRNLKKIFFQSLFYYLKKHYGLTQALLVSVILKINTRLFILLTIICLAFFLRLYDIERNMSFIGDQGWFYLSARDMLVEGEIPLVGITSSRIWLHQGPIWTYMLAMALWIGKFNPISGAYLSSIMDVLTLILLYKIGNRFFSKKVGIITSLLFAVSPIAVDFARMPYHTSPIPLFVSILIYSLLKWIKDGNAAFFPVVLFTMSMLYNFQLSTVVFWPVVIGYFIYGIYKKQIWVKAIKRIEIVLLSCIGLVTPMIPVLIYDIDHGFRQTFWYGSWFVYKILQLVGLFPKTGTEYSWEQIVYFFLKFNSMLIFPSNTIIAGFIFLAVLILMIKNIQGNFTSSMGIVFTVALISIIGFFIARTPSDAYLPMLIPALLLLISFFIAFIFGRLTKLLIIIVALICISNIIFTTKMLENNDEFYQRNKAAEKIVELADGRKYNLHGRGPGSEFSSFTMNYEYLTWVLGHPPGGIEPKMNIIVEEDGINPEIKVSVEK